MQHGLPAGVVQPGTEDPLDATERLAQPHAFGADRFLNCRSLLMDGANPQRGWLFSQPWGVQACLPGGRPAGSLAWRRVRATWRRASHPASATDAPMMRS